MRSTPYGRTASASVPNVTTSPRRAVTRSPWRSRSGSTRSGASWTSSRTTSSLASSSRPATLVPIRPPPPVMSVAIANLPDPRGCTDRTVSGGDQVLLLPVAVDPADRVRKGRPRLVPPAGRVADQLEGPAGQAGVRLHPPRPPLPGLRELLERPLVPVHPLPA